MGLKKIDYLKRLCILSYGDEYAKVAYDVPNKPIYKIYYVYYRLSVYGKMVHVFKAPNPSWKIVREFVREVEEMGITEREILMPIEYPAAIYYKNNENMLNNIK